MCCPKFLQAKIDSCFSIHHQLSCYPPFLTIITPEKARQARKPVRSVAPAMLNRNLNLLIGQHDRLKLKKAGLAEPNNLF